MTIQPEDQEFGMPVQPVDFTEVDKATQAIEPDETFNLDDWISEAKLPEKSTVIYRRADLIAELDNLEREIKIASDEDYESSIADVSVGELRKQWNEVAETFRKSGLKVTVRAVTDKDRKAADTKAGKFYKENEGKPDFDIELNALKGLALLSEVIVSPKMSIAQIIELERAIGWGQVNMLVQAYLAASGQQREPTAPLSQSSSRNRGGGMF